MTELASVADSLSISCYLCQLKALLSGGVVFGLPFYRIRLPTSSLFGVPRYSRRTSGPRECRSQTP